MMAMAATTRLRRPLPSLLMPSISTMNWSLQTPLSESMPPLHYLNMQEMAQLRQEMTTSTHKWMENVPQTIDSLFKSNSEMSPIQYDYAILSLSLLLLGNNCTDEAHNLVTPYSWPEEIHTSYGPVRYSTADAGVVNVASYIHSLVHRKEGWNVGEFGMIGWSNADYWGRAWARPFRSKDELHGLWRKPLIGIQHSMLILAKSSPDSEIWCKENIPELFLSENVFVDTWDPRGLHRLCAQVTKEGDADNTNLLEFAERACTAEMNALLFFCLEKAGYAALETTSVQSTMHGEVLEDIALSAANRISSAHAAAFSVDGIVVLRNLARIEQSAESELATLIDSVVAGISTRLLNTAACRSMSKNDVTMSMATNDDWIGILLPTNKDQADKHSKLASVFNMGPLFVGDALVVKGDLIKTLDDSEAIDEFRICCACDTDDEDAIFINRLHGSRGETPTTVLQWSKGTVHHSSSN